jgi:hypothetical protein
MTFNGIAAAQPKGNQPDFRRNSKFGAGLWEIQMQIVGESALLSGDAN